MSSIIDQIEKCIKRYDYLINKKRTSREITNEEEQELILLTPNVARPLLMMAELVRDTIAEMKEYKIIQKGGTNTPAETKKQLQAKLNDVSGELEKAIQAEKAAASADPPADPPAEAKSKYEGFKGKIDEIQKEITELKDAPAEEEAKPPVEPAAAEPAPAADAEEKAKEAEKIKKIDTKIDALKEEIDKLAKPTDTPAEDAPAEESTDTEVAAATEPSEADDDEELKKLLNDKFGNVLQLKGETAMEKINNLNEMMSPIIAQLAVFIEEEKNEKPKKSAEGESKYKDIGTATKNTVMLAINKLKSLLSSGEGGSGILNQIDPKTMIPGFPDDQKKQQEIFDQLEAEIKSPIDKFKSTLSNDIKDIATSSVDGIMNAISLIPGVGTTLQLWRLLNNVVVIMSKTTNSVSQAKTEGGKIKGSINAISQNVKGGAENAAAGAAGAAVPAVPAAAGSLPIQVKTPTPEVNDIPEADGKGTLDGKGATEAKAAVVVGGSQNSDLQQKGGQPKQTKLWTTKRYKKEYEKSVREFKKTRKRFMSYLKRKIL